MFQKKEKSIGKRFSSDVAKKRSLWKIKFPVECTPVVTDRLLHACPKNFQHVRRSFSVEPTTRVFSGCQISCQLLAFQSISKRLQRRKGSREDEGHKFARGAMTDAFEVRRKQQFFQGQKGSHSAHTNDNFMGHGLTQLLYCTTLMQNINFCSEIQFSWNLL